MSWRTNGAVLRLRNTARAVGLNRLLASWARSVDYEDRFGEALFGLIRPGDVVFDVGANVGFYSRRFSDAVGASGQVVAYEPSPANLLRLEEEVSALENVVVMPLALGDRVDTVLLEQGEDPLGATSRVVDGAAGGSGRGAPVQMSTGDHLVSTGAVPVPNVIKIDTEGFELDVLRGFRDTLRRRDLRALCVEVHFGLLERRGMSDAPAEIERLLIAAGFSLEWPDASHVVARRTG